MDLFIVLISIEGLSVAFPLWFYSDIINRNMNSFGYDVQNLVWYWYDSIWTVRVALIFFVWPHNDQEQWQIWKIWLGGTGHINSLCLLIVTNFFNFYPLSIQILWLFREREETMWLGAPQDLPLIKIIFLAT